MKQRTYSWLGYAIAALCGLIATVPVPVFAQVVPDTTLPINSNTTTDGSTTVITGGTQAGSNLFHSFEQFSVTTGGTAYFNNAPDIQNIISRVTSSSISNIDGLIRANDTANLFLINPNGIIFGPSARLNIGGSFLASTASSLYFADGTQISAAADQNTPLLTISTPVGLQLPATAGNIRVQDSALAVQPGKNLRFVGKEVYLEGDSLMPARAPVVIDSGSGKVSFLEIVPDATLPTNSALTLSGNTSIITGGTQAGSNLFHSFEQFSIPTYGTVYFNNAPDIQNIIARVTGSSASNVDGLIAANNTANLILLNPNGIIFEPDASLNIGGSMLASTATSLKFADGIFSTDPHATTLSLASSIPVGLQFGETPRDIRVQVSDLQVEPGKTLALVGGDVMLDGLANPEEPNPYLSQTPFPQASLQAPEGRIELGSVAGVGEVSLTQKDNNWILGYSQINAFGDISLKNGVSVYVGGRIGGSLQVQAARLEMSQAANIFSGTDSLETNGELLLKTTEAITLSNYSSVSADVVGPETGKHLRIETGKLIIRDNSNISATTKGEGLKRALTVKASDSIELSGTDSGISTAAQTSTSSTGSIKPSMPSVSTQVGVGKKGDELLGFLLFNSDIGESLGVVSVASAELISIESNNIFFAEFDLNLPGSPGAQLTLETGKLIVQDGASVSAATFDRGAGGNLVVKAHDSVELIGTAANTQAPSGLFTRSVSAGDAGNLTIETGLLTVRDGAEVNVSSIGSGNAGNLQLTSRSVRLDNQALISSDTKAGQGNIFLRSQDLLLRRGSNITTNATGTASGGNIDIDTDVLVALEDSDISANAQNAKGGQVIIDTRVLFRTEDSDITATSELGTRFSGTVKLNTPNVDPSRGLVSLPAALVNTEVVQACTPSGSQANNEFVITGSGGLPPNPNDPLSSDAVWIDFDSTTDLAENRPSSKEATQITKSTAEPLVEATGWAIDDKGKVVLTAAAPTATPDSPILKTANCHVQ